MKHTTENKHGGAGRGQKGDNTGGRIGGDKRMKRGQTVVVLAVSGINTDGLIVLLIGSQCDWTFMRW